MCSKSNPPEADECQHCGARLKPLFVGPADQDPAAEGGLSSLSSQPLEIDREQFLQGSVSGELESTADDTGVEQIPDDDEDAWLERFRSEAVQDDLSAADQVSGSPDAAREAVSDDDPWMDTFRSNLLGGDINLDQLEEADTSEENDTLDEPDTDWLSRFRSGVVPETPDERDIHTIETSRLGKPPEEDVLSETPEPEAVPESSGEPESIDLPDWSALEEPLSTPDKELLPQEPPAVEPDSAPDWLSGLKEDDELISAEQSAPGGLSEQEEISAGAEPGEAPDWLSGLGEEEAAPAGESAPEGLSAWMEEPAAAGPGEVPDWLSGLGEEEAAPAGESAPEGLSAWMEEPAAAEPGDVPDWLSGLGEEEAAGPAIQQEADRFTELGDTQVSGESAHLPEWLANKNEEDDRSALSEEELWDMKLPDLSEEQVPEWLSAFDEEEDEREDVDISLPSEDSVSDGAKADLPPGFREMELERGSDTGVEAMDAFEAFDQLRPVEGEAETPDWLKEAFDRDTETLLEDEEQARKKLEDLMEDGAEAEDLPEWFAAPRHPPKPAAEQPAVPQDISEFALPREELVSSDEFDIGLPREEIVNPEDFISGLPEEKIVSSDDFALGISEEGAFPQGDFEAGTSRDEEVPPGEKAVTPRWLQNIIDETRVNVEAELESAIAGSIESISEEEILDQEFDLKDDLSEEDAWIEQPLQDSVFEEEEVDFSLADANLPSWLQEARSSQEAETGRLGEEGTEILEDEEPEIDFTKIEQEEEEPLANLELTEYDPLANLELKEYEPGKPLFDELGEAGIDEPSWVEPIEEEPVEDVVPEGTGDLDSAAIPEWLTQVHARQTKETTMLSLEPEEDLGDISGEEISKELELEPESEGIIDEVDLSPEMEEESLTAPWLDDLSLGLPDELPEDFLSGSLSSTLPVEPELPEKEDKPEEFDFSFESPDVPEWMADLSEEQEAESGEEDAISFSLSSPESLRPFSLAEEPMPGERDDWLDELPEEDDEAALDEEILQGQDIESAEMPDWLSQIRQRQSGQTAFLSPLDEMEEGDVSGITEGQVEGEGETWLPERISEEEKHELDQASGAKGLLTKDISDSKPVWLEDLPEEPISPPSAPAFIPGSVSVEESPAEDFDLSEQRDSGWLEGVKPGGEKPEPAAKDRIDLARATLPAWLEAMRPVEGGIGDSTQEGLEAEAMETAGPLAGISGALSAEPVVAGLHKISSGPSVLNISDVEYERADLLSKLLADEEKELKPIPRHTGSQKRLNWIISAVVIMAALIPSLLGFPSFSLPVQEPMDLVSLFATVDELPKDSPALVVYDVEPGYTAEMEAVAGSLFYHLLGKQVQIVTVSTEVTGPALVDRVIRNINLPFIPLSGEDYLHLGYLSGGAAGIQQFTRNPSLAGLEGFMLPEDSLELEGSVWDVPFLSGISSLSDFSMVSVVVNDADRARMWIEQAGPQLGDTPLVMVVSTGLEPAVRPYYEGRDPLVDGLLAGVPAAAAYDLRFQRTGGAALLWNPYNATLTVVFLALIGAAAIGLYNWIKELRQKAENEGS